MASKRGDPQYPVVHLGSFEGGESVDYKYAVANSFLDSEALEFKTKASQMTILPGLGALSSSSVFVDLPVDMCQDPTGVRWIIGDQGNLYKMDTSNTITFVVKFTENSGYSIFYNQLSDMLYIPGQQAVSMYGPITTGTPSAKDMQFGKSASVANGVVNLYQTTTTNWDGSARNNLQSVGLTQGVTATSQVTTNATNTYSVPNAISESATAKCPFAPDVEPFYSIAVYVDTVGTGNATLTLHDGFNRALGTVTINHASLTTGYNEFIFTAPGIRSFTGAIQSGLSASYHWHITSSVSSDTMKIRVLTASDQSTADMILFTYRMVKTNNGWHPATIFGNIMVMGNGQYVSTYNFSNDANPSNNVWKQEAFPLDAGYEACGICTTSQYCVIAAEKRSTSGVANYQDGFLYFWDGQNPTYNFKVQIPMGSPYGLYTNNNLPYFVCAGALYTHSGVAGASPIRIRPIAYQTTDYLGSVDKTIVNPNMMAMRYNQLMVAYPSSTTNQQIRYGVYSWGAIELIYPNSFGYGYRLSNNAQYLTGSNALKIGMMKNFVDTMFVSSAITVGGVTSYKLDMVNNSSQPAANFSWTSLIYDGGVRYKMKKGLRAKVSFLPWPSGATLTGWYSLERGAQVTQDANANAYSPATGDTSILIDINLRFYEAQWGFYGTCSNPASVPTITDVAFELDPESDEADLRVDQIK